ncbi:uncharacterized protein LOC120180617 [Hibiscus syriacus]|uniref:uncharacterized protein LOC120180617 n=1 Tax=Hibiscus syriacus TaxID=106335 RepID=UPI0019227E51|nr:uncharacterized protein LOC120180617 [Hibiscus syriacus]
MIIGFWNVRGFNNPHKQLKVFRRLDNYGVDVICLMESRIRRDKVDSFCSAMSADWHYAENYDLIDGGRLWIFWRKHLSFSILRKHDQAITIWGTVDGHTTFITAIYGNNSGAARRRLWDHLHSVGDDIGSSSWVLGGDFNIIAKAEESSDFDVMGFHCTPDMKEFQDCLESLDLMDHPFLGPLFTWSNKQEDSFLVRKLDRILVNNQWLFDHSESFVEFAAQGVSDHCLGLLWTRKGGLTKRPRPFKFFNCWTGYELFLATVRDTWHGSCGDNAMNCMFLKLRRLKPILKNFNKEYFSDISSRVNNKRVELEQIQIFNLANHDQRSIGDEKRIHAELMDLELAESVFYKQKAKAHWLREGDLNTRFFHQRTQANKKRNTIRIVVGEDGMRHDSFEGMAAELVNFFTNLIGSTDPLVKGCSTEILKDLLGYSLPKGADFALTKEAAWEIVGNDFISTVRHFFHTSCLLPAFNSTALVLIPKSFNACLAKDFRPISCCSVVYKTITRILVNKLIPFFPGMISLNQTAFVKGRNIVDNTLLAQEVIKGYSRKSLSPRCAIKIDLQKAFDSVNWDFLLYVLGAMRLPDKFCNWIRTCITTPMYSVSLNGSLVGKGTENDITEKLGVGFSHPPLLPWWYVLCIYLRAQIVSVILLH